MYLKIICVFINDPFQYLQLLQLIIHKFLMKKYYESFNSNNYFYNLF